MIFIRPDYFEVILANWKKDDFHDEILICTIDKNYEVVEHAPVDLFIGSRNMAIIYGCKLNGEKISKELMQIGTKKQEYAGWEPINCVEDFERMLNLKINKELAKKNAYKHKPKVFSFYKQYE